MILLILKFLCFFVIFLGLILCCFAAENDPQDGKRKCEALWPIFKISHQRSRYIFDLFYKRSEISRELYEFCLEQGYADANLIAKWKKVSLNTHNPSPFCHYKQICSFVLFVPSWTRINEDNFSVFAFINPLLNKMGLGRILSLN